AGAAGTKAYVGVINDFSHQSAFVVLTISNSNNPSADTLAFGKFLPSATGYPAVPKGIAFSPSGNEALISDQFVRTVTVVDVATNSLLSVGSGAGGGIAVGDGPFGIATANVGGNPFAFVANISDNTLQVINLTSNTVVRTIPV